MSVLAAAGAAGVLLAGLPLIVVAAGGTTDQSACAPAYGDAAASASLAGDAPVGLDGTQLRHASTIVAEGRRRRVPERGIVVALATALQESRLRVYANDGLGGDLASEQADIARSLALPHEVVGTDHGSLGIFQQQWPWWGSMRELMDTAASAGSFYEALARVPGWEGLPVTVAAQAVQRSLYPSAYADDEPLARHLLAALNDGATAAAGNCATGNSAGKARYPLPADSGYVDRRNFGASGRRWASTHTGTDFSMACGTPVLAATDGTVRIRTDQPWAGPWLVQVATEPGALTTWYAHMERLDVTDGQQVRAGDRLGAVGELGNATGCHLHFEVHPRGGTIYEDPVDPTAWLARRTGR